MTILVSACLLGECCKYSGGHNYNQKVIDYVRENEIIPVCPEVMGGLPVPRAPAEIVNGIVINRKGECVDAQFRKGVERVLELIDGQNVDMAILQPRSPSCGSTQIYDGTFSGTLIPGKGLLAQVLSARGISCVDADKL